MKKTLGYGYKLSNESLQQVMQDYYPFDSLAKSKREILAHIKQDGVNGDIPSNAKPKVFKVVVECED